MKALLIKYHCPTNTKGSRLSVQSEGCKPKYVPFHYEASHEVQVHTVAKKYFSEVFAMYALMDNDFAIGTLPNGDNVAVLI